MGCRCRERSQALRFAVHAAVRGRAADAAQALRFSARTFVEDARNGSLRQAAQARLAQMRARAR